MHLVRVKPIPRPPPPAEKLNELKVARERKDTQTREADRKLQHNRSRLDQYQAELQRYLGPHRSLHNKDQNR